MRNATAIALTIFAIAAAPPRAAAEGTPRGPKWAQAEIQIALCAPPDKILQALDVQSRGTPIEVWQFDDAMLTLSVRGSRLRLRVAADGRSEFTLKVADQDCARLDPGLLPPSEGKCEYDVQGQSIAGAVSLTRRLGVRATDDLVAGRVAPAQMLSATQIRYLREIVGIWPLPPGIRILGPMQVRRYRTMGDLYDIDISQLPAGEQFAEISRKVPLANAARAMEVLEADLSRAGIEMCADQSSQAVNKLRSLLRHP